jgi:hypothetical protein
MEQAKRISGLWWFIRGTHAWRVFPPGLCQPYNLVEQRSASRAEIRRGYRNSETPKDKRRHCRIEKL